MCVHRLTWPLLALLCGCATEPYVAAPLDAGRVPAERAAARLDGPAAAAQEPWSCTRLGAVAVARAPAVRAAAAAVTAATADVAVAAQRRNPTLSVGLDYNSDIDPGDDSHFSTGPVFSFLWPRGDRRRIRAGLARTDVVIAQADLLAARWSARDGACRAAAELAAAEVLRERTLARQERLVEAAALARAAVEAGLGDAFEWQSLQLEANASRLAALEARRDLHAARARLAGSLNLPLATLRNVRFAPWQAPALPALDALQAYALGHHPAILAAIARYDSAEHALELAVSAQYPDIELSPGYLFEQGDNVLSLVGGLVVPLFASQQVPIAAAAAHRDLARAMFERVQAAVMAAVQESWAGWAASEDLLREATAARTAIAAGVDETRAAQRLGLTDALMVKRAELQLAAIEIALAAAARDRRLSVLALEHASARAFDDPTFPDTGAAAPPTPSAGAIEP